MLNKPSTKTGEDQTLAVPTPCQDRKGPDLLVEADGLAERAVEALRFFGHVLLGKGGDRAG